MPSLSCLSPIPTILKVVYDLHQVDPQNLRALRDTLLAHLERYHTGPRNIIVQLCLAISGLALQYPEWQSAVQQMIDSFGRIPAMVPTLLQFLTVLPEEISSNTRIPVTVSVSSRDYFPSSIRLSYRTKITKKDSKIC